MDGSRIGASSQLASDVGVGALGDVFEHCIEQAGFIDAVVVASWPFIHPTDCVAMLLATYIAPPKHSTPITF